MPEEKEILNMSANCQKISIFNSFEILVGKLLVRFSRFIFFSFKILFLISS